MRHFATILCTVFATLGAGAATGDSVPLDGIAAVVDEDVITNTELRERIALIELQLRQQAVPAPPQSVLERQVLERLIMERIQLQLAAVNGIRVDDDSLNETIKKIAAQNNLTLATFREVLESDGVDFAQFRESIRNEIVMNRLRQQQVGSRISITEQELNNFLATQKAQGNLDDEYHLAHILIALSEGATPEQIDTAKHKGESILDQIRAGGDFTEIAITMSDGQQALEGGDLGWRKAGALPTIFANIATRMNVGETSDLIRSPSGFHIIKLVDYRASEPHIVKQTRVRHILLLPNALRTDSETRQQLTTFRDAVITGRQAFEALAREYSEDHASAADGGELGWVSPGSLPPGFEEQIAGLKPNEITPPFQSDGGWHIAQVLERREYDDTRTFTRGKARELLHRRKLEQETQAWLRRLRDEAYVDVRLGT